MYTVWQMLSKYYLYKIDLHFTIILNVFHMPLQFYFSIHDGIFSPEKRKKICKSENFINVNSHKTSCQLSETEQIKICIVLRYFTNYMFVKGYHLLQ